MSGGTTTVNAYNYSVVPPDIKTVKNEFKHFEMLFNN